MADDFVFLGRLGRPHGLKGELRVASHASSPSLYDELPRLYLRKPGEKKPRSFKIGSHRSHKGLELMWLRGIEGRDQAEQWTGSDLLARRADLPREDPDDIFLFELAGLTAELPDGQKLGVVERVESDPQELWVIRAPGGAEILLPGNPEFVRRVDMEGRTVVVDPPPGLIDLYLGE